MLHTYIHTYTNINSPIGKNVSLCALKYGTAEGDVGCWKFSQEILFSASFMVCHWRFLAWSNFACEAIALRGGLLWLGSYDSALSKEELIVFHN